MGATDAFNVLLKNQNDSTFVFDVKGLPLNFTMTRYPEFSNAQKEIILHMDSEFTGQDMSTYVESDSTWANYTEMKQREQLWLHQSTVNSLLYDVKKTLSGEKFNAQMFTLMSEVYYYYGASTDCEGRLSFPFEKDAQPVTVDVTKGVVVGDTTHGLRLNLQMWCANDTMAEKELAVDLTTGMHLVANFTWDNFVYWISLSEPQFMGTVATSPVMSLYYHNWDVELTAVLKDMTDEFNLRHSAPTDLKTKAPLFNFVAGLIRATLISPFVKDEFLFGGFKMITDR